MTAAGPELLVDLTSESLDELLEEKPSWFSSRLQWVPSSMKALIEAEKRVLQNVRCLIKGAYVPVRFGPSQIWTITASPTTPDPALDSKVPLVLVHGFAGGSGMWAQNLEALSQKRIVHSIDLLGFGRSSRPAFSKDATLAEMEWIQSMEDWRKQMGIERMILCGHSLGGFLASSYAIEYPKRVRHLILVDPWGMPVIPPDNERQMVLPTWVKLVARVATWVNPLSSVRAAGPWGRGLVQRFRPDLGRRYAGEDGDQEAIYDYIYHCNVQRPSGETAFKNMTASFGWAKRPMIERLPKLDEKVPLSLIFGGRSWIDSGSGYMLQDQLRLNSYVKVHIVRSAGHHVYADAATEFNEVVQSVCAKVDESSDVLTPPSFHL